MFYEKGVIANFAKCLSRCWILKSLLKKKDFGADIYYIYKPIYFVKIF